MASGSRQQHRRTQRRQQRLYQQKGVSMIEYLAMASATQSLIAARQRQFLRFGFIVSMSDSE